ncbi:MAG: hypothetical protein Q8765_02530, partial [Sweet potato little leaf phytoplasma]|nr:hypothetical protein [Sweet potato little leaf phytoplasma]
MTGTVPVFSPYSLAIHGEKWFWHGSHSNFSSLPFSSLKPNKRKSQFPSIFLSPNFSPPIFHRNKRSVSILPEENDDDLKYQFSSISDNNV